MNAFDKLPVGGCGDQLRMNDDGKMNWVSKEDWIKRMKGDPVFMDKMLDDIWEFGINYPKNENGMILNGDEE